MELDFELLRAQWALKAPMPSEADLTFERTRDMQSNPHNDRRPSLRDRRNFSEITSDCAYEFADGVLKRQYGRPYEEWLEANYTLKFGIHRY